MLTQKQFIDSLISKFTEESVRAVFLHLGADPVDYYAVLDDQADTRTINRIGTLCARAAAVLKAKHASPSGRPSGKLTGSECHTLLDLLLTDGCAVCCERAGISAQSMGRAVMGQTVAVESLAAVRSLL